jgi:hypothetical protein
LLPVWVIRKALSTAAERDAPGTVYVHPWELDERLPAFPGPWKTQLRMRMGTRGVERKLSALTFDFRFQTMHETAVQVREREGEILD